jgi:hypothetical protein
MLLTHTTPLPTTARPGAAPGRELLSPVQRLGMCWCVASAPLFCVSLSAGFWCTANVSGGELVVPLKRKLFFLFVLCVGDLIRAVSVIRYVL